MTDAEALGILVRRRQFAQVAAISARALGIDGAVHDREAEALSWAIRRLEALPEESRQHC